MEFAKFGRGGRKLEFPALYTTQGEQQALPKFGTETQEISKTLYTTQGEQALPKLCTGAEIDKTTCNVTKSM